MSFAPTRPILQTANHRDAMPNYQSNQELPLTKTVQGTTATPSQIKLAPTEKGLPIGRPFAARFRVCDANGIANATNATIAPVTGKGTTAKSHTSGKDIEVRSQLATTATGTLTLNGVAKHGETVVINGRTYAFDATAAQDAGDVAVDITATAIKAQGTLTIAEPVTAGDCIVVGDSTYVFVANGTGNSPGEIDLGANEAATKLNIVAAINGSDAYSTPNTKVTASAFDDDVCTLTAIVGGTAGDAIPTAELGQGLTHASNVFNAATLGTTTAGVDTTAAQAVTALVAAITADTAAVVTAADGAGDTVVLTAKTAGAAGNDTTTETMANGSFGGAAMTGGADALDGEITIAVTNATAETVTLRVGPAEFESLAADHTEAAINVTHAAP